MFWTLRNRLEDDATMTYKCQVPHCTSPADLGYMGRGVCQKHWEWHADDGKRFDLRQVFGLTRPAPQPQQAVLPLPAPTQG